VVPVIEKSATPDRFDSFPENISPPQFAENILKTDRYVTVHTNQEIALKMATRIPVKRRKVGYAAVWKKTRNVVVLLDNHSRAPIFPVAIERTQVLLTLRETYSLYPRSGRRDFTHALREIVCLVVTIATEPSVQFTVVRIEVDDNRNRRDCWRRRGRKEHSDRFNCG